MESSYRKLAIAITINTIIMFLLTYVMISSAEHFVVNFNRIYMALIKPANGNCNAARDALYV